MFTDETILVKNLNYHIQKVRENERNSQLDNQVNILLELLKSKKNQAENLSYSINIDSSKANEINRKVVSEIIRRLIQEKSITDGYAFTERNGITFGFVLNQSNGGFVALTFDGDIPLLERKPESKLDCNFMIVGSKNYPRPFETVQAGIKKYPIDVENLTINKKSL